MRRARHRPAVGLMGAGQRCTLGSGSARVPPGRGVAQRPEPDLWGVSVVGSNPTTPTKSTLIQDIQMPHWATFPKWLPIDASKHHSAHVAQPRSRR